MKHLHLFDTQEELNAVSSNITPPWVAFVKQTNSLGMHDNKSITDMFNTQTKSVTITENGITTVTPDSGFGSMDKVNVTVNVPSSGNTGKWLHINSQYNDWNYNYLTRGYINALFNLDTHEVIDNSFAFTPEEGENGNPEIYEKITAIGFEDGKLCFYNLPDNRLNPCVFSLDSNDELEIKVISKYPEDYDNPDFTEMFIRNIKNDGFNTYYFEAPGEYADINAHLDDVNFTINGIEVIAKEITYPFYIDGVEYRTPGNVQFSNWINTEYNTNHYICWSSEDWGDEGHSHPYGTVVNNDHTRYLVLSEYDQTPITSEDNVQKYNRYVTVEM